MPLSKRETAQIMLVAYAPIVLLTFRGVPTTIASLYLAYPWTLFLATFVLPMLALVYTGPKSWLRPATLPFVALGTACYHALAPRLISNRAHAGAFDGPFMLLFLTAVDALLLQRLYVDANGKEHCGRKEEEREATKKKNDDAVVGAEAAITQRPGIWTGLSWVSHVIFSYRAIGTSREAKNVPQFSSSNPKEVPSRTGFLLKRGLACLGAFLLIDVLNNAPPPDPAQYPLEAARLFPPRELWTTQTLGVRIFSTVFFWFILRITIGFIYNIASFIGVATFLTSPADWPPYFGSVKDAYTLRKFWAVFWHSGLRNPLVSTANFLTYDVFGLGRGTLEARYSSIFLTFGISAIIHKLVDNTSGIPPHANTAHVLFLMQAVGITLEDFAQWVFRQITGGQGPKRGVENPDLWERLLGYAWVVVWLVWTTPSWSFANITHQGDPLFPFSFVGWLKAGKV